MLLRGKEVSNGCTAEWYDWMREREVDSELGDGGASRERSWIGTRWLLLGGREVDGMDGNMVAALVESGAG